MAQAGLSLMVTLLRGIMVFLLCVRTAFALLGGFKLLPLPRCGALLISAARMPATLVLLAGIVSGQKKRFQNEGFDLDLAYISPRVIAMGLPAQGKDGAFLSCSTSTQEASSRACSLLLQAMAYGLCQWTIGLRQGSYAGGLRYTIQSLRSAADRQHTSGSMVERVQQLTHA